MVSYKCIFCQYSTSNKNNYTKHLNTKKHLLIVSQKKQQNEENEEKNEENEEKVASHNTIYIQNETCDPQNDPQNICQFCSKKFSRSDNLKSHISVCKLNFKTKIMNFVVIIVKNHSANCIKPTLKKIKAIGRLSGYFLTNINKQHADTTKKLEIEELALKHIINK